MYKKIGLVDKLVEVCTENVEEVTLAKITLAKNENKYKCSSCTLNIVLFSIISTINAGTGTYFVYCKYRNCKKETDPEVLIIKRHFLIRLINGKYQRNNH